MLTFLAAALLSGVLADSRGFKVGQTVQTASGEIIGQPSSWKPEVSEYLGIPYCRAADWQVEMGRTCCNQGTRPYR